MCGTRRGWAAAPPRIEGVCGAIRQYSTDAAVTDAFLEDLYDGTVAAMIATAAALNALGQVPIFAVTNGFFNDPARGGASLLRGTSARRLLNESESAHVCVCARE